MWRSLLLHERDETIPVDRLNGRAHAEMTLERRDVAVVSADRVRREILRDQQPANVLFACGTDLHDDPLSSCGSTPVGIDVVADDTGNRPTIDCVGRESAGEF